MRISRGAQSFALAEASMHVNAWNLHHKFEFSQAFVGRYITIASFWLKT
jgi:hypothetical protein